jgi:electron transport complex protein RnfG
MSDVDLTIAGRQPDEPSGARLVLTLAVAGMISGLALASVFQITKPIIEKNNREALERAIYKVVPGSSSMEPIDLEDAETGETKTVYAAFNEQGEFLGWAIDSAGAGFQDTIHLLYGYEPETKRVMGMEVLESRETPGLGDKIYKDHDFVAQFRDLSIELRIVVVKDGANDPNEIDAITGATISSKAVAKIINTANEKWAELLPPDVKPIAVNAAGASGDSAVENANGAREVNGDG